MSAGDRLGPSRICIRWWFHASAKKDRCWLRMGRKRWWSSHKWCELLISVISTQSCSMRTLCTLLLESLIRWLTGFLEEKKSYRPHIYDPHCVPLKFSIHAAHIGAPHCADCFHSRDRHTVPSRSDSRDPGNPGMPYILAGTLYSQKY